MATTVDWRRSGSLTYDVCANLLAEDGVCGHHLGKIEMLTDEGIRGCQRPIAWCTDFNERKPYEKLSHACQERAWRRTGLEQKYHPMLPQYLSLYRLYAYENTDQPWPRIKTMMTLLT